MKIAIDGPSGAGKSTMAKRLAANFGFLYVDTGALYRAIGYSMLRAGIDPTDRDAVIKRLPALSISLVCKEDGQQVFVDEKEVGDVIRTEEVSMAASIVSAYPEVRAYLLDLQRKIADKNDVVMDGRDIGTVVLPDADLKIFLTASPEERAGRRQRQLEKAGIVEPYDKILADILQRDKNDCEREIAPLRRAEGAVLVDSTANALQDTVDILIEIVKGKCGL